MPNRSWTQVVSYLTKVSLAAILGILGPWLAEIKKLALITDYFQPWANTATSVFGALAFATAFARYRRMGHDKLERRQTIFLVVLIVSFVTCLILKLALGDVLVLGRIGTIVAWTVWLLCYILLFASIAIVLCVNAFLSK